MSASGTESEDDFASAESDTEVGEDTEVLPQDVGESAGVKRSSDASSTSPIHSTPPLPVTSPKHTPVPTEEASPIVEPDHGTTQLSAMKCSDDLSSGDVASPVTETPPPSQETTASATSSPSDKAVVDETLEETSPKTDNPPGDDSPKTATDEPSGDASPADKPSGPTPDDSPTSGPAADGSLETAADNPPSPTPDDPLKTADPIQRGEEAAVSSASGGGWGGWGGWGGSLWSSVSNVAGSAQAIGQKVTAVIASVEDTLGVPSPEELAVQGPEEEPLDQELCRLADDIKEHDPSPDNLEAVREEPHHVETHAVETGTPGPPGEEGDTQQQASVGGVTGFLSGFAAAVQSTSQGLVTGGLDALETIGKKTMEVLSEGDPGLANKRAMLGVGSSPTLSQLLKEAKSEGAVPMDGELDSVPLNYSRLFEEYHGVDHLEALELLSRECAGKVHSVSGDMGEGDLHTLQEMLKKLSECFTIDEDQENLEDDSSQLGEVQELFSSMTIPFKVDKLMKVSSGWREKVVAVCSREEIGKAPGDKGGEGENGEQGGEDGEKSDRNEAQDDSAAEQQDREEQESNKAISKALYENGLRSLAEMTSTAIELFRKMAEVSLLPDIPHSEPLSQAHKFNRLTVLVSNELDALASVHSEAITQLDLQGTTSTVTSLYLESSNSGSYVQDAFQLLLPVLKLSAVQQLKVSQQTPGTLSRN